MISRNEDGFILALSFDFLLGMLIGVDKIADFRNTVDTEEYEILKQLATGKFVEPVREQSQKEKGAVITNCDSFIRKYHSYYKLQQFRYKMRLLLQKLTFVTNCNSTIIKNKSFCSFASNKSKSFLELRPHCSVAYWAIVFCLL